MRQPRVHTGVAHQFGGFPRRLLKADLCPEPSSSPSIGSPWAYSAADPYSIVRFFMQNPPPGVSKDGLPA